MTGVKICGINDPVAFDTAVAAGADWIGFVVFAKSPRFVTPAQAAALSARHSGGPKRVALLVEPTDVEIADVMPALKPDALQLYTSPERVRAIKADFGVSVWRGVGVTGPEDLPASTEGADALLIEAKPPANATRPGGNAARFDWGILAGWKPGFDWLMAGGLTPKNVAVAINVTGAPAVDVSSGVERTPGVKDPAMIRAFIEAAKAT